MKQPSKAAREKACELVNNILPPDHEKWTNRDFNTCPPLMAFARYIDEVSEIAKKLTTEFEDDDCAECVAPLQYLILPDEKPDPLEDALDEYWGDGVKTGGKAPVFRQLLARHGLKIVEAGSDD